MATALPRSPVPFSNNTDGPASPAVAFSSPGGNSFTEEFGTLSPGDAANEGRAKIEHHPFLSGVFLTFVVSTLTV